VARLVAGLATSHLAMVLRDPPEAEREPVSRFRDGFRQLSVALEASGADTLIVISAEHVNKFFLDNMPAFAVGTAETYDGPVEDIPIAKRTITGDAALGEHLLRHGLDGGIDWARAGEWELDHGMMVPLHFLDPEGRRPIVPVFVNCAVPPYPTLQRCYTVGQRLGEAVRSWSSDCRVAILACGGLSHSPGDVRMGYIDEAFDRGFLDRLTTDPASLAHIDEEKVEAAGSSAGEVRSWIMAAGAFDGQRWQSITYEAIRSYGTGCAQALTTEGDRAV